MYFKPKCGAGESYIIESMSYVQDCVIFLRFFFFKKEKGGTIADKNNRAYFPEKVYMAIRKLYVRVESAIFKTDLQDKNCV